MKLAFSCPRILIRIADSEFRAFRHGATYKGPIFHRPTFRRASVMPTQLIYRVQGLVERLTSSQT